MTSTAQQLKGDTPQTQRTLMLSGNWNKTFPAKVETESKSLTFVKKLLTVAISNITYLRSMFPEEAYANRSLDGLSLKILRDIFAQVPRYLGERLQAAASAATSLLPQLQLVCVAKNSQSNSLSPCNSSVVFF